MDQKKIIAGLAFLFVIAGLFSWGYVNRGVAAGNVDVTTENNQSLLKASETFYDFGSISMKNGKVTKEFVIKNESENDIAINNVVTSCMCTEAFIVSPLGDVKGPFGMTGHGGRSKTNDTLKVGESRIIRVVFDPNAHGPAGIGRIERKVSITHNIGNVLELGFVATVTP